jgi:putative endonuclease
MMARAELGRRGEALVAAHLERQGYRILARNVRVGRAEIDLIAARADLVVFCEVRSRSSDALIDPVESLDRKKLARIRSAAGAWLATQQAHFAQVRFDAASVLFAGSEPSIRYFEEAF